MISLAPFLVPLNHSAPSGGVNVGDAILILRYIVGLITVFPVER